MILKLGTRYTTWCYGQASRSYRQVTNIKRPHCKLKFLVLLKHFHIMPTSSVFIPGLPLPSAVLWRLILASQKTLLSTLMNDWLLVGSIYCIIPVDQTAAPDCWSPFYLPSWGPWAFHSQSLFSKVYFVLLNYKLQYSHSGDVMFRSKAQIYKTMGDKGLEKSLTWFNTCVLDSTQAGLFCDVVFFICLLMFGFVVSKSSLPPLCFSWIFHRQFKVNH